MADALMVVVTCERGQAEMIATRLVEERLAACVNVLPAVRSCYVWGGKLTWSDEVLLVIKTTRSGFERLKQRVVELHSYDVPEIVAVPVEFGLEKYLEWVRGG